MPILIILAAAILVAAALWLAAVGVVMALRPQNALNFLRRTAESYSANFIELIPRLIVGAALVIRAPQAKYPALFEIGGWFIVISSLALLAIPLRWHSGYAVWWADRIPHWAVRLIAPFSIAAAAALLYAAF